MPYFNYSVFLSCFTILVSPMYSTTHFSYPTHYFTYMLKIKKYFHYWILSLFSLLDLVIIFTIGSCHYFHYWILSLFSLLDLVFIFYNDRTPRFPVILLFTHTCVFLVIMIMVRTCPNGLYTKIR